MITIGNILPHGRTMIGEVTSAAALAALMGHFADSNAHAGIEQPFTHMTDLGKSTTTDPYKIGAVICLKDYAPRLKKDGAFKSLRPEQPNLMALAVRLFAGKYAKFSLESNWVHELATDHEQWYVPAMKLFSFEKDDSPLLAVMATWMLK